MLQIFSAKTIWRSLYLIFNLKLFRAKKNLKSPFTYFTGSIFYKRCTEAVYVHAEGKSSTSNNLSTCRRSSRAALEACCCFSLSRRGARTRSGRTPRSGSERPCAWWCWPTLSLAEGESGRIRLPHSAQSCDCPPRTESPCQSKEWEEENENYQRSEVAKAQNIFTASTSLLE